MPAPCSSPQLFSGRRQPPGNLLRTNDAAGTYRSRCVLAFVILFLAFPAFARSENLFPNPVYPTPGNPQHAAVGDFNEDGRPDLISANYVTGGIAIQLGLPDGTLKQPTSVAPLPYASFVAAADFNSDDHLDLAVATNDARIYVLFGSGTGTFTSPSLRSMPFVVPRFAILDFNRDGKQDIAVASSSAIQIELLPGNGDGTFAPAQHLPLGAQGLNGTVVAADFNADGKPDIAAGQFQGVGVILGDGAGGILRTVFTRTDGLGINPLLVEDFNADGKADLAGFQGLPRGPMVMLGLGDGAFQPPWFPEEESYSRWVGAADLDLDGFPDLASSDGQIFRGNGTGAFFDDYTFPTGTNPSFVLLTDLSRDGRADLVLASSGYQVNIASSLVDGEVSILPSQPTGRFVGPSTAFSGVTIVAAGLGDFDADGASDMVVAQRGRLTIHKGNLDGTFVSNQEILLSAAPGDLEVADLNGDGRSDFLTLEATQVFGGAGKLSAFLASTAGTFGSPVESPVGGSVAGAVPGDFNEDGAMDLLIIHRSEAPRVFLGTGNGAFGSGSQVTAEEGFLTAALGDFNEDGHLDVILARPYDAYPYAPRLEVRFGNGHGEFPAGTLLPLPASYLHDAVTADLDEDGHLDVALLDSGQDPAYFDPFTPYRFPGTVHVLRGSGQGTFTALPGVAVGLVPTAIAAADLDADGKIDLVTSNRGSYEWSGPADFSVLRGGGDGTFRTEERYRAGAFPRNVIPADLNGDQRVDLVLVNSLRDLFAGHTDSITVHFNSGPRPDADGDGLANGADPCTDVDRDGSGDPGFPHNECSLDNCPAVYNPSQVDSDEDGWGDACDNCPTAFNGDQLDRDADGQGDSCDACTDKDGDGFGITLPGIPSTCAPDNCASVPNPGQENGDGDALGDACDPCPIDPENDYDKDGVCGNADNCPHAPNANQLDTDGDGLADACDSCTDVDGDGFGNPEFPANTCPPDNCPVVANPDQSNSDVDPAGDACDPCPLDQNDDSDRDGHCADVDNCPTTTNAEQEDSDRDGIGDVCDECTGSEIRCSLYSSGRLPVGAYPANLTLADFNTDGTLDVALVDYSSDRVSIAFGLGGGAFGPGPQLQVGDIPFGIVSGDLNHDGGVDLIVTNAGSRDISVLLGHGNGTFEAQRRFPAGDGASSPVLGDFNRDGRLDVAVSIFWEDNVAVYLGSPAELLQGPVRYATAGHPVAVGAGDFNVDGNLDLVAPNSISNALSVLYGIGDGTFRLQNFNTNRSFASSLVVGQFDFNPVEDVAILASSTLYVYPNGNFSATPLSSSVGSGFQLESVGDLDSDGYNDLLVSSSSFTHGVVAAFGSGNGRFDRKVESLGPEGIYQIAPADLTGDGRIDLVATIANQHHNPRARFFLGTGPGKFVAYQSFPAGGSSGSSATGDFDGDGKVDVVVANTDSSDLSLLRGQGDGTLMAEARHSAGFSPKVLGAADFSGDGRSDLLYAISFAPYLLVRKGSGTGFLAPVGVTGGFVPESAVIADFNSDGRRDLVVSHPGVVSDLGNAPPRFELKLGVGDGTFTGFSTVLNQPVWDLVTADFNGDGLPDLGGFTGGNRAFVMLGDGHASFTPPAYTDLGFYGRELAAGDLNSDGLADLIALPFEGSSAVVLMRQMSGSFSVAPLLFDAQHWKNVLIKDFDSDGWNDLGVLNGPFQIHPGNGDGSFSGPIDFPFGNFALSALVDDFNSDLRPDLELLYYTEGVVLHLNQGLFPDPDHDGIGNAADPCTDTDQDGTRNPSYPGGTCPEDNCPQVSNAGQADADADGSGDACDVCPGTPDPLQQDNDLDGIGDACDDCTDRDADGLGSAGFPGSCPLDNCPLNYNPGQESADGDGIGDACDACTDTDHDGRGDPQFPANRCLPDNCPEISNPNQSNLDGDGPGDVCDPCTDTDHDGFGNPGLPATVCPLDNCPSTYNPTQADRENDGEGDACDQGEPPVVEQITVIRERKQFICAERTNLCCVDPPFCSCCCVPDQVFNQSVDVDRVTIIARVSDTYGLEDIREVFVHFHTPPDAPEPPFIPSMVQMYDSGNAPVGTGNTSPPAPILSGDAVAGDGLFTRTFYLANFVSPFPELCIQRTDAGERGGVFSSAFVFPQGSPPLPGSPLSVGFHVVAQDLRFNQSSAEPEVSDIQAAGSSQTIQQLECGPPSGNGGCLSGSRPPVAVAGSDFDASCTSPAGANVVLDGSASSDPEFSFLQFEWFEFYGSPNQRSLGAAAVLPVTLTVGAHTITLRVTDSEGAIGLDNLIVTISDPLLSDTDNDGAGNTCDSCPDIYNPGQEDGDADLTGDACDSCTDTDLDGLGNPGLPANTCPEDNCPDTYNPLQENADGDGLGDACDDCSLDPLNDLDGDGICGNGDNCPQAYNPDQGDLDGDSIGNACDPCTDADHDGFGNPGFPTNTCIPDNCPVVANPDQHNTDGDALGDACDACALDPLNDQDGDGVCGDVDNCPSAYDQEQLDLDGDGLGDACDPCTDTDGDGFGNPSQYANICLIDNCSFISNPEQSDLDGDTFGDECDPCPNDVANDLDADGHCADQDNCPLVPNPDQGNQDGDALGDACDPCTDPDADGYGTSGFSASQCALDNCPTAYNPGQQDADTDSGGDACDACPSDPLNDADLDGACADLDNCPARANPDQADTDGDGQGDLCDNCRVVSNPSQVDTDHDSIGDACDLCLTSPNPGQEDGDSDHVGDVCDNCPASPNSGQEDGNRDGSGDACQPSAAFNGCSHEAELLACSFATSDPQGEPLSGSLEFRRSSPVEIVLGDAFLSAECSTGFPPDGVPSHGIAFAYGTVGAPYLFDTNLVLGCGDGQADFEIAEGTCNHPTTAFDSFFSLNPIPPYSLCVRPIGQTEGGFEYAVVQVDPDTFRMTGAEAPVLDLRLLFGPGLPTRFDISQLHPGTHYQMVLQVTDGNTVPFVLESFVDYQGEDEFTFNSNSGPTAVIAQQPPAECSGPSGALVRLDGSQSSDPDSAPGTHSDLRSFEWFLEDGGASSPLGTGELLETSLPLGSHLVTLRVVDSAGEEDRATATFEVVDTAPPQIDCPVDAVAECSSPAGALVPLTATAYDVCEGPVALHNSRTGESGDASGTYPLGTTEVTFAAADSSRHEASCVARVAVRDTVPPTLLVSPSPIVLWPPSHQLVEVDVDLQAADLCSVPQVALVFLESSEPDDASGPGDGGTHDDIQDAFPGTRDTTFRLRAERDGGGPGRRYTGAYEARDAAGNTIAAAIAIDVPHDLGGVIDPVSLFARQDAGTPTIFYWNQVDAASSYSMIRGHVGSLRFQPDSIDLGAVECVESPALDPLTTARNEPATPAPGEAFFYLVSFHGETDSSYGTASADRPRLAASGGCFSPAPSPSTGETPPRVRATER